MYRKILYLNFVSLKEKKSISFALIHKSPSFEFILRSAPNVCDIAAITANISKNAMTLPFKCNRGLKFGDVDNQCQGMILWDNSIFSANGLRLGP